MNMQTQGQPPGQQAQPHLQPHQQSQTSMAQQNASSSNSSLRSWQVESGDFADRRVIVENIMHLFQNRKTSVQQSSEWHQKLPDFVRRLEEQLYRDAATKEEYQDLSTLEQRLQSVARRLHLKNSSNRVAAGPSAMRNMIPTSRMVSTMIPTPGARMIPTPGLNTAAAPSSDSASGTGYARTRIQNPAHFNGVIPRSNIPASTAATPANSHPGIGGMRMVHPPNMGSTPRMHQPCGNGHLYHNMNVGSTSEPSLVNGRLDSPFIGNGQHSLAGNTIHSSSSYLGQGQIQRDRFQMQRSGTLNGESSTNQTSKMIPVPGLPSQMLQHLQSENAQGSTMHGQEPSQRLGLHRQPNSSNNKRQESFPSTVLQVKQECHGQNTRDTTAESQQIQQNGDRGHLQQTQNNSHVSQPSASERADAANGVISGPKEQESRALLKKQQWLVLLRHANKCSAPEGQCPVSSYCLKTRQLLSHTTKCRDPACQYVHCQIARALLRHHAQCHNAQCALCAPVRQRMLRQRGFAPQGSAVSTVNSVGSSSAATASTCTDENHLPAKRVKDEADDQKTVMPNGVATNIEACMQPVLKKVKVEPQCPLVQQRIPPPGKGKLQISASQVQQAVNRPQQVSEFEAQPSALPDVKQVVQLKVDHASVKIEHASMQEAMLEGHSSTMDTSCMVKHESSDITVKAEPVSSDMAKSGKSKVVGISLIELFTTEQIRDHITSLRQWVGQSKAKAERNQAMEHQLSDNACRLCAVERLTFEPPPLYCTACGGRIKRNVVYYTTGLGETRHYFCIPCYNDIRNDTVEMEAQIYPKARLEKKKNDEETEEAWVQCDSCNLWQHQICALFNGRRNEAGDVEYICPLCLMTEMENGVRKPLPSTAVLGAKDLPRTVLSDHLEQRLARRLKQERTERARAQGKTFEEVPGAEALVIRVVSSVDKKLEVKQRFLEIFKDSDYSTEYPYKSKVLLLFQRIEGVEVCLFGMYVQEFGAECPQPDNRRLYIAYLDSVKYFRPEVKTVNGEALRTFVYHEILIGYLDYCKRRGFGSCYIWACPPLRGEDYILYCHPEIQKTPKSDKLREWYLTMLSKATKENIVVELTNFYDYFFISPEECKANVTAARLPYFDGDYWPGAAEDMLLQLHQEEEEKRKLQKKGVSKKGVAKRTGVQAEMVSNASRDLQLMHKLGQSIFPMKEDFIMVHMHHSCRHCRLFITSGYRWVCKQCKSFQLCSGCYDTDQKLDEKDRHPWNSRESHQFFSVEVTDVPADTKDKDEIMESEFFDTRQAFLSLCQGNHYQHDTLRRAKHSSMMVLYHLHNPTAPAFVTTCNLCHYEIETGHGWRCDTCPDFDVCAACFPKELPRHPHKLTPQLSIAERDAQNTEARQQRVLQLRKVLELLVHSSQCCAPQCQYPKCRNVKNLFRHGTSCKTRASGGCGLCKMMWHLLQLHARACKESDCRVPRCKDLKEHLRRSQQQSESRRRAAVMEMIRQRTSDLASSTS